MLGWTLRFLPLALLFLCLAQGPVLAQDAPTAHVGADLSGLRSASAKDPESVGLRMRVVRSLLDAVQQSESARESRELLEQVEAQMGEIRALKPSFPYPWRVLARLYYRRDAHEEVLELLDEYAELAPLDQEMRSLYVKSLLRLATREEDPQPERKKQAAAYVGDWFDSGDAPSFGATLGSFAVWLVDDEFRAQLLDEFSRRYESDPSNLNLVISYAACLSELGRNESAWRLVQDAEKLGLCDSLTGARHPVAYLLEMVCPEVAPEQSYDGMKVEDLEALAKRFPQNASLPLRAALVLKRRGDAALGFKRFCERRIAELEKAPQVDTEELRRWEKRRDELADEARKSHELALPLAERAREVGAKIDTLPLILGDLRYRIGDDEGAVRDFSAGVEALPTLPDLRESLARALVRQKRWAEAAEHLVAACRLVPVQAGDWDDEVPGSLLPVPKASLEQLVAELAQDPEARATLTKAFVQAAGEEPRNPNLKSFVAMVHFFGGDRAGAIRWMREAEKQGACGEAGYEHPLAAYIALRDRW